VHRSAFPRARPAQRRRRQQEQHGINRFLGKRVDPQAVEPRLPALDQLNPNFFVRAVNLLGPGRAGDFCGPGVFCGCVCSKIRLGLGVWLSGPAQNPGPVRLRLLVCLVKARAQARPGPIIYLDCADSGKRRMHLRFCFVEAAIAERVIHFFCRLFAFSCCRTVSEMK
jgi:hypothetical protein